MDNRFSKISFRQSAGTCQSDSKIIRLLIFFRNGTWRIIFLKSFSDKREANQFEMYLKKLRNKSYIRRVFSDYFLEELSM
jgi:hypothetical protein